VSRPLGIIIDDDLCLSPILGRSIRLFLVVGAAAEKGFGSDSDPDAEDDARERYGESCAVCCCGLVELQWVGSGWTDTVVGDIEPDIVY